MEDRILDYFGDEATWDQQDLKIVVARYFYMEAEARLYAARLNQEGMSHPSSPMPIPYLFSRLCRPRLACM
jgi:hypothetical protein